MEFFAPADAACLVRLRHPRWGVPCVRPCEPYRLLDNEQPCDWNRTRELKIRLSGHAGWLSASLAKSGLEPCSVLTVGILPKGGGCKWAETLHQICTFVGRVGGKKILSSFCNLPNL